MAFSLSTPTVRWGSGPGPGLLNLCALLPGLTAAAVLLAAGASQLQLVSCSAQLHCMPLHPRRSSHMPWTISQHMIILKTRIQTTRSCWISHPPQSSCTPPWSPPGFWVPRIGGDPQSSCTIPWPPSGIWVTQIGCTPPRSPPEIWVPQVGCKPPRPPPVIWVPQIGCGPQSSCQAQTTVSRPHMPLGSSCYPRRSSATIQCCWR